MEYLDVDIKCKILLVATEVVKAKQMLKSKWQCVFCWNLQSIKCFRFVLKARPNGQHSCQNSLIFIFMLN